MLFAPFFSHQRKKNRELINSMQKSEKKNVPKWPTLEPSAMICRPVPYLCCFLMVWQNLKKKNLKKSEYSVKCPVKLLFDWLDFVCRTVSRTELKLLLPL